MSSGRPVALAARGNQGPTEEESAQLPQGASRSDYAPLALRAGSWTPTATRACAVIAAPSSQQQRGAASTALGAVGTVSLSVPRLWSVAAVSRVKWHFKLYDTCRGGHRSPADCALPLATRLAACVLRGESRRPVLRDRTRHFAELRHHTPRRLYVRSIDTCMCAMCAQEEWSRGSQPGPPTNSRHEVAGKMVSRLVVRE